MAASIMGFIRQAALGDPLVPYEQRVERSLGRILASRSWSKPQRDWLVRIANQTKALMIVDREARLNRLFGGELEGVLRQFQREVWAA
jgi:type I restriction enzyme R subunit